MLFHSPVFIFAFVPVVFVLFRWFLRYASAASALNVLLLASLFFYGYWKPIYLVLFVGSLLLNFQVGKAILGFSGGLPRRVLLALGLAMNLGLIGFFKYSNFIQINLAPALGFQPWLHSFILPLGISFYTFQQMAFLIDCYRGKIASLSGRDFALYVSFFPQLIAGPIVIHDDLVPQFQRYQARPIWDDLTTGSFLFLLGLIKKVILADSLIPYVTNVFDANPLPPAVPFFDAASAALAYGLQLYFDFSGYSDMALGVARLFGFRLPMNFDSPYQARSIPDFWRRWHITLSHFFREYLYYPLGGSRHSTFRTCLNLLLVMSLVGLWHGAGWTFVLWGLAHGIFQVVARLWRSVVRSKGSLDSRVGWLLTQLCVFQAWILFRSPDLSTARMIFSSLYTGAPWTEFYFWLERGFGGDISGAQYIRSLWLAALAALAFLGPNTGEIVAGTASDTAPVEKVWQPSFKFALVSGFLFFLYLKSLFEARPSEFLYFNF